MREGKKTKWAISAAQYCETFIVELFLIFSEQSDINGYNKDIIVDLD